MKLPSLLVFINILSVIKSCHSYILSSSLFQSRKTSLGQAAFKPYECANKISSIVLYAKKKSTSDESSSSESSSPKPKANSKKTTAGAKAKLSDDEYDTDLTNIPSTDVPKAKKSKTTTAKSTSDNNDDEPITDKAASKKRPKKIDSNDDSLSSTSEPITSSTKKATSSKKSATPAIENSSSSSNAKANKESPLSTTGLPSLDFDNDFAELEKSLKDFDLSESDDLDGTFRSIESGEFDIDALMKMAPQDMPGDDDEELMMMGDMGDMDLDDSSIGDIMRNMGMGLNGGDDNEDDVMFQAKINDKISNGNKNIADVGGAVKGKRKSSSKSSSSASGKGGGSKKKKDTSGSGSSYGDSDLEDDGSSSESSSGGDDDTEDEQDEDIDSDELTMLETGSKEVSESELFDSDEESESLDDLADFDFSALSIRDDDDEDDDRSSSSRGSKEDKDDDEEEEEDVADISKSSSKKIKKGAASSPATTSIKSKGSVSLEGDDDEDNDGTDDDEEDEDMKKADSVPTIARYDSNIGRITRETELAPSTIAAASGFAVSGQFSSKEKAAAQASASAATRAASAKRKKELIAGGMTKAAATASLKKELEGQSSSVLASGGAAGGVMDEDKLMIDGFEVDKKLGVPPPLEEFRRLMESLGAESGLFDDTDAEPVDGILTETQKIRKLQREYKLRKDKERASIPVYTQEQLVWHSSMYEGGHPEDSRGGNRSDEANADTLALFNITEAEMSSLIDDQFNEHTVPLPFRLLITSVVTSVPSGSGLKNTALEVIEKVYEYIKKETDNDERIEYQILMFNDEEDEPLEQLNDVIQMWCEGYNTYHLIDGSAMKAAWGGVVPAIVLSQGNLEALLNQVRWALQEDVLDGTLLTPRLRTVRLRGGAKDMAMGFNTDRLENEFSVVSVR